MQLAAVAVAAFALRIQLVVKVAFDQMLQALVAGVPVVLMVAESIDWKRPYPIQRQAVVVSIGLTWLKEAQVCQPSMTASWAFAGFALGVEAGFVDLAYYLSRV